MSAVHYKYVMHITTPIHDRMMTFATDEYDPPHATDYALLTTALFTPAKLGAHSMVNRLAKSRPRLTATCIQRSG